jgi:proteasome lid subunit RPN8/RPN11
MKQIRGISKDTLLFILEASRSAMPAEFAGLLRAERDVITDVLLLHGTEAGERMAMVKLYMLPTMRVAGSVHSHPSGNLRPSLADLSFFSRTGRFHIITAPPFDLKSWRCFDATGKEMSIPVLEDEGDKEAER